VRNEKLLHTVKKERNILRKIKIRKPGWIGHILRSNCLLKHAIEGKREREREEQNCREDENEDVSSY
jgi:hypothetical protein